MAQNYNSETININQQTFATGLSEDVVAKISAIKNEPSWLLDFRLKAYNFLLTQNPPNNDNTWANLNLPRVDLQEISYHSSTNQNLNNPEIRQAMEGLGVVPPEYLQSPNSNKNSKTAKKTGGMSATDVIIDSGSVGVSISTLAKQKLADLGIIFCSISTAVVKHPELFKKYFATVIPPTDNYFATLNSAVFSDGTFVYIPAGVRCPVELSSYFRMNTAGVGQFERTLIVAEKGSYVSYLEGCTAPSFETHQLHSAVVELVAMEGAEIKYATVQNWYAGDENGNGGVLNFVTKRGLCSGKNSKISWTQVETGSAITWKYPSVILKGDGSQGVFYSLALTKNHQQADTGTKMVHIGKNTKSLILAKSVVGGSSKNTYRGRVKVVKSASNAKNHTRCDAIFLDELEDLKGLMDFGLVSYLQNQQEKSPKKITEATTLPEIDCQNPTADLEHEASSGRLPASQIAFLCSRGLSEKQAQSLLVLGFCKEIFERLPFEFAVEAKGMLEEYL